VHVVQRPPGQPISLDDTGDELRFVHSLIVTTMLTTFDTEIHQTVR
jgi:hypothetical protein